MNSNRRFYKTIEFSTPINRPMGYEDAIKNMTLTAPQLNPVQNTSTQIQPQIQPPIQQQKRPEPSNLPVSMIAGDLIGGQGPQFKPTRQEPENRSSNIMKLGKGIMGVLNNPWTQRAAALAVKYYEPEVAGYLGNLANINEQRRFQEKMQDKQMGYNQNIFDIKQRAEEDKLKKEEARRLEDAAKTYKMLSDEEKKTMGLDVKLPYQISPDGKVSLVSDKSGVTVNVGDKERFKAASQGYQLLVDPETGEAKMEALEGGPAWQKQQEEKKMSEAEKQREGVRSKAIVDDIDRAINMIESGKAKTGAISGALPRWVNQGRADLETLIRGATGKMALDRLIELKRSGATLGAVSEQELELLKAAYGSLDLNASEDIVLDQLRRIRELNMNVVNKLNDANIDINNLQNISPGKKSTSTKTSTKTNTTSPKTQPKTDTGGDIDSLVRKYL